MLGTSTIAANLLVAPSLEALLSRSASRLDLTARLQRLHAAALLECAITGYADLKITEIAERARVSTASIYKTYKDRDALLVAAIETLFSILASDVIEIPQYEDPKKRVEHLLIAHGEVYAQPLSTWLFRLYASLAWSGQTQLRQTGLQVFEGIDSFWCGFLNQLIEQGHLVAFDPRDIVPHLLGPIERCTIIWQLGCGDDGNRRVELAQVAQHGANALFKLWGRQSENDAGRPAMPLANDRVFDPTLSQMRTISATKKPARPSAATRLNTRLANLDPAVSPQDVEDRLMLAASGLCQERGYQKAAMGEVAAWAKVSTATMYKLYNDKADLFASAVEREFKSQIAYDDALEPSKDPQAQIASALFAIATRATDPQWVWIYNVLMASEASGTPRMVALAREQYDVTEAFLRSILSSATAADAKSKIESEAEIALTINFLLGAVERHSVLSLILFGNEAVETQRLAHLASVSTASYLRLQAMPD